MTAKSIAIFAALAVLQSGTALAEPPPAVRAEIEYLLQSVETSGCTFFRNGSGYDGARAKAHLLAKYDYLAAKGLIKSTEDFIDKGATKSSVSGQPYRMKCGNDADVQTSQWLRTALALYRASVRQPSAESSNLSR
jgi:Family of unknown function (DUF5329)